MTLFRIQLDHRRPPNLTFVSNAFGTLNIKSLNKALSSLSIQKCTKKTAISNRNFNKAFIKSTAFHIFVTELIEF
jgi:hypothetical protein